MDELDTLMRGKNQKLTAAYIFWPDDLRRHADQAGGLAKSIQAFTGEMRLKPPRIPLPIEL